MKGFDTLKVKSAVKGHNKFDLSRTHLTTMNFGEIIPVYNEEVIPGDNFSIDQNYFSRMLPLAFPTYGKFCFKTVTGFVPYHQLAWDADAWLGGKTTWEGQTPKGRFITIYALHNFIWSYCKDNSATATATDCDYSYIATSGSAAYMKFSKIGKYYIKILNALGYALPQGVDMQSSSTWMTTIGVQNLSAFPFLAFFKMYNDYMSQSQRYNTSQVSQWLQNVKYGKSSNNAVYNPNNGQIGYQGMKVFFDGLFLNYENDYFTSAWSTPNSALTGGESITQMKVPSTTRTDRVLWDNDANGVQIAVNPGTPATVEVTQRALEFLKSFDDWVRRNNYSGSRAVQQIYSRFGIKTEDYKSHYAEIITTDEMPVQVGDVTQTVNNAGSGNASNLGEYAGKGIMTGKGSANIKVNDYGIILILGYFTVRPMNAYGFDRKVLRNEPLDYYNPEFDGLGAEAIPLMEYYENPLGYAQSDTTTSDSIFGFTERYNSYRFGRDQITGEFRNYINTAEMNGWHTGRNLAAIRKAGNLVAQSTSVNTLPQTDSEYNRIFSVQDGSVDHFYLTCQFNVKAIRPMLNLNQVPRLGEGDTVVPRNGNVIS